MDGRVATAPVALGAPPDAVDFEERRLIAAALRGDQRAFAALYRRHVGAIYALCLRLTGRRDRAEDAVQETFLAAWRALRTFQTRSRLRTWLHRIAVNVVLQAARPQAARLELNEGDVGPLPELSTPDSSPPIDVEAAIALLPDGARRVLVLVSLYGYTHEEAATVLGIAIGTSKTQLHRARALLSVRLGLEMP